MDPNDFLMRGSRLRKRQLAMLDEIERLQRRGVDDVDPTLALLRAEEQTARESLGELKREFLTNA